MPNQIEEVQIDALSLDPKNPRLGRRMATDDITQGEILERMRSHSLEELATSFLENGFWAQEALLCVEEQIGGATKLIVVEGNRRLAALKLLKASFEEKPPSQVWGKLIADQVAPQGLFEHIPILKMPSRKSVDEYLGYRHVTGIKEWKPAEKAEYISYLIDERGFSYEQVMRKIGSKTEAVRRNYIAFRLYRQASDVEDIDETKIIEKFSVLFLALRTSGVQTFLGVDIYAEPKNAETPVPAEHVDNLREFIRWLFGDGDIDPIIQDSRQVDKFSRILQSNDAVRYLRSASRPTVDHAYVISGGEEADTAELLSGATFNIEQSLTTLHLYKDSEDLAAVAKRLIRAARQVEAIFPLDDERPS